VSPGGAPQLPAVGPKEGGRREEASPGDGTFAALLAALAPMAVQPDAPPAGAVAPPEGQALLTGTGLTDPMQALLVQPREGGGQTALLMPLPGEAAQAADGLVQGAPAGQAGLPGELIAVEQSGTDPIVTEQPAANDPPGDLPGPQGPEPAGGGTGLPGTAEAAEGEPAAPAGAVQMPAAQGEEAEPSVRPSGAPDGQAAAGGQVADQPIVPTRTGAAGGEAAADGGGAPGGDSAPAAEGRAPEAASDTAPDPAPDLMPAQGPDPAGGAAGPAAARGVERLTAGRLQAEQLVAELTRTVPELQDGEYRLTLRLHPEHLGEVRLELHLNGREVYAAMEVSSADARQALESRGEQLRQGLSDAGYQLTGFEVATGEGRQARQGGEDEPAGWSRPAGGAAARPEPAVAPAVGFRRSPGPRGGRLDTLA